jgi:hypothetical protein
MAVWFCLGAGQAWEFVVSLPLQVGFAVALVAIGSAMLWCGWFAAARAAYCAACAVGVVQCAALVCIAVAALGNRVPVPDPARPNHLLVTWDWPRRGDPSPMFEWIVRAGALTGWLLLLLVALGALVPSLRMAARLSRVNLGSFACGVLLFQAAFAAVLLGLGFASGLVPFFGIGFMVVAAITSSLLAMPVVALYWMDSGGRVRKEVWRRLEREGLPSGLPRRVAHWLAPPLAGIADYVNFTAAVVAAFFAIGWWRNLGPWPFIFAGASSLCLKFLSQAAWRRPAPEKIVPDRMIASRVRWFGLLGLVFTLGAILDPPTPSAVRWFTDYLRPWIAIDEQLARRVLRETAPPRPLDLLTALTNSELKVEEELRERGIPAARAIISVLSRERAEIRSRGEKQGHGPRRLVSMLCVPGAEATTSAALLRWAEDTSLPAWFRRSARETHACVKQLDSERTGSRAGPPSR